MSTPNVDAKTLMLMKMVEEKRSEIEKIKRPQWETNKLFQFGVLGEYGSKVINILTINDIRTLVEINGWLFGRQQEWNNGCVELDVSFGFLWQGFTYDQWNNDLYIRVNQINIKKEEDKLTALEDALNAIMSPELRRELELKRIEEALK